MQNIQHHINFALKNSLIVPITLQSVPKKGEILLEKMEELLQKKHNQKSISSYAVLVLQTSKFDGSCKMHVDNLVINNFFIGRSVEWINYLFLN